MKEPHHIFWPTSKHAVVFVSVGLAILVLTSIAMIVLRPHESSSPETVPANNTSSANEDHGYRFDITDFVRIPNATDSLNYFGIEIGEPYAAAKSKMAIDGWEVVLETDDPMPRDARFPEIGFCGTGSDAICNIVFSKNESDMYHLNVQSKCQDAVCEWIVVGDE